MKKNWQNRIKFEKLNIAKDWNEMFIFTKN